MKNEDRERQLVMSGRDNLLKAKYLQGEGNLTEALKFATEDCNYKISTGKLREALAVKEAFKIKPERITETLSRRVKMLLKAGKPDSAAKIALEFGIPVSIYKEPAITAFTSAIKGFKYSQAFMIEELFKIPIAPVKSLIIEAIELNFNKKRYDLAAKIGKKYKMKSAKIEEACLQSFKIHLQNNTFDEANQIAKDFNLNSKKNSCCDSRRI